MSFQPREYPEIVHDVLLALTDGVVREPLSVPPVFPADQLFFLSARPVRRISRLQGVIQRGDREVPWVFTDADFLLVSSTGREDELDALRFRPRAQRPVGGSVLEVSYWPRELRPLPLTDLNVGSVTRTLLETISREIAEQYVALDRVYRSAFLDTADGANLDKVVAVLGIERYSALLPRGKVRFFRRAGSPGTVTLPVGTVVLAGQNARYLTTRAATLQLGESSVEVPVVAETVGTEIVEAGAIDRLAEAIAGIERVSNQAPTWTGGEAEDDGQLRARARRAFHGVGRGTYDALVHAIEGLDAVRALKVHEFVDGVPGTVHLEIALADADDSEAPGIVDGVIARMRPAGVRVTWGTADLASIEVLVDRIQLLGVPLTVSEIDAVESALTERLKVAASGLPPGGTLGSARVAAVALADERIADIALTFAVDGAPASADVRLPAGRAGDLRTPIVFPVATFTEGTDTGAPIVHLSLSVLAPLLPAEGVAFDAARVVFEERVRAWGDALEPGQASIDFGAFATAVRSEAHYGLVREEAAILLEADGRFERVVDGGPARPLLSNERITLSSVDVSLGQGAPT